MKFEESIAFDYLTSCGHQQVVYEPDGKVPPDFSLGKTVAVEVRRLSQNYFGGPTARALEEDHIPFEQSLRSVFAEFKQPSEVDSYLIAYRFKRPTGNLKSIRQRTKQALVEFLRTLPETPHWAELSANASLTVLRAKGKSRERFRIAISSDLDGGGFVEYLYSQNIEHCIQEKTKKIQAYRQKYKSWWLVLIDMLGVSLEESPVTGIVKPSDWDRIIIVDPSTKDKRFEL